MLDCTRGSVVSDISQCVGEISGRDIADRMYELRGKLLPGPLFGVADLMDDLLDLADQFRVFTPFGRLGFVVRWP